MDSTVANANIKISADVASAQQALKSVSSTLRSLNSSMNSMVPGATTMNKVLSRVTGGFYQLVQGTTRYGLQNLASALGQVASSGYETAETMQSAAVAFKTLLPETEDYKQLLTDIEQTAVKTPFDVAGLTKSTQKLVMVTNNGAEAKRTIENLGKAVTAAGRGDAELTRMATNLQQIGANAYISARDIREFGNAGIDILGLVSDYTGKAKDEAEEYLKSIKNPYEVITAAINAAGEGTGKFANVYEESAETIAQASANLQDSLGIFGEHVLETSGILTKLKDSMKAISEQLSNTTNIGTAAEALGRFVEKIQATEIIEKVFKKIFDVLAAVNAGQFDNIIVFFQSFYNTVKQFSGFQTIANIIKVILDLFSNNHTAAEVQNVATQIGKLVRAFLELKFAMKVASYASSFGQAMVSIYSATSTTLNAVKNLGSGLSMLTAKPIWLVVAAVVALVAALAALNPKGFQTFVNSIAEGFSNVLGFLGDIVKSFFTIGSNLITGLWNGLVDAFGNIIGKIKEMAVNIANAFKSALGIHSPSTVMRDEVGKNISAGIAEGIVAGQSSINAAMNMITQNFALSGEDLVEAAEDVLEKLADLQEEWLSTLNDMGAINTVEEIQLLRKFASQYEQNSKARIALDEKIADLETDISKEIIDLVEDFNTQFSKAVTSAKDYYDMFEYTQSSLTRSTKSVIEGLQRQNNNMLTYYRNLAAINEMGFDSDFLQEIMDQGMDAAAEVAGLATATQEEIDEINELWATRGTIATDIAKVNTQELREETLAEIDYLQSGLETKVVDVYDTGAELIAQFTSGIYDTMPTLQDAIVAISDSLQSAATSAAQSSADAASEIAEVGDAATTGAEEIADYTGALGQLDIQAFDTADVFSMLKNMLSGIPWYIYAIAIAMIASKFLNLKDNTKVTAQTVQSGMYNATAAINKASNEIQNSLANGISMFRALSDEVRKTYNCMWQISNYDSVFRQATSGMLGFVGEAEQQVINLVDFTKGQYSTLPQELKVNTKEATGAIADIAKNGLTNISESTRATLDKVQQACGVTINTTESAMQKSMQTIDYAAQDAREIYQTMFMDIDTTSKYGYNALATNAKTAFDSVGSITKGTFTNIDAIISDTNNKMQAGMYRVIDSTGDVSRAINSQFSNVVNQSGSALSSLDNIVSSFVNSSKMKVNNISSVVASSTAQVESLTKNQFANIAQDAAVMSRKISDSMWEATNMSKIQVNGVDAAIQKASKASAKAAKQAAKEAQLSLFDYANAVESKVQTTAAKSASTINSVSSQVDARLGKTKTSALNTMYNIGNGAQSAIYTVSSSLDTLGGMLEGVAPQAASSLSKVSQTLSNVTSSMSNSTLGKISQFGTQASMLFSGLGGKFSNFFNNNVKSTVETGMNSVSGVVDKANNGILGKIGNFFGKAKNSISSKGSELASKSGGAVDKVSNTVQTKAGFLTKIFNKISSELSGVVNSFTDFIFNILDKLAVRLSGFVNKLASMVTSVLYTLLSGLGNALAALLSALSDPYLLIGAAALLAIAAAVWLIADACKKVAEAIHELILAFDDLIDVLVHMSEVGDTLNIGAIAKVGLAIDALGAVLASGTITNILGAISAGAASSMVASFAEITNMITGINAKLNELNGVDEGQFRDRVKLVVEVVNIIKSGFGGHLWNVIADINRSWQSASILVVVSNVDEIVTHLFSIKEKLSKIDGINDGKLSEEIKTVMEIIQTIKDGFGGHLWNAIADMNRSWQSESLTNVVSNIDEMLTSIRSIYKQITKLTKGGEIELSTIQSSIEELSKIVGVFGDMFSGHLWNAIADMNSSWQAESLKSVASSVDEMLGSIQSISNKMKEFKDQYISAEEVKRIVEEDVKDIVTAVDKLFNGEIFTTIAKANDASKANSLAEVASSVDTILGCIQSMCNKLSELAEQGIDPSDVTSKVSDIETIVQALAKLNFDKSKDDIEKLSEKAAPLSEASSSLDTILGCVQSMCNKLSEFTSLGYTVSDIKDRIKDIEDIVNAVAAISINEDGNIDSTKEASEKIKELSSNVSEIITSVKTTVDIVKEWVEGIGVETVKQYVEQANGIIEYIGQLASETQLDDSYATVVTSTGDIKTLASNVSEIITSVKNIVDTVQTWVSEEVDVEGLIKEANSIVMAVATLADEYELEDSYQKPANAVSQIATMATQVKTIIENVKGIIDTINGLEVTPEEAVQMVGKANKIVAAVGNLALPERADDYYTKLSQNLGLLNTAIGTVKSIIQGCSEMFNSVNDFDAKYPANEIQTKIQNINDDLKKIAGPDGLAFPEGSHIDAAMVKKLEYVVSAMQVVKSVAEAMGAVPSVGAEQLSNIGAIIDFIKEKMAQLPTILANYTNDFNTQGQAYADAFKAGWSSKYGDMETIGHEAQSRLWSAIEGHMQDEYYQGAYLAENVINGIKSKYEGFTEAGRNTQGRYWSGLQSKFPDEYYQGQALIQEVLNGINSKIGTAEEDGKNVSRGFASGINSEIWRVNQAAGNLSETAINKLRQLLKIASPSKVMAELGSYVAQGFADGITDELSTVETAGEALANAVMSGYDSTIEPMTASIDTAADWNKQHQYDSRGGDTSNITINQNNNVYNDSDISKTMNDLVWAITRA